MKKAIEVWTMQARELLQRLEWSAMNDYLEACACPECGGLKPENGAHALPVNITGHEKGCMMAELLEVESGS